MPRSLSVELRSEALRLGFVSCGISRALPLPDARAAFDERIDQGHFAGLPWMTHVRAKRATEPESVLAGAQSIISLAAPYDRQPSPPPASDRLRGRIARYALGRDYHRVLEKMLKQVCQFLEQRAPEAVSRVLVDYGPLAERAYAARSGIGWLGKSTNLLLPQIGSWVLLGEVVTTAFLDEDVPLRKSCGSCRRCVAACPTGAIEDNYVLKNDLCISFQTIENRGPIPRDLRPLIGDWIFGCDICQEVCPVGRAGGTRPLPALQAADADAGAPALLPLLRLDEDAFRSRFAGRAIMRAKRDGLLRNVCVALGNLGDRTAVPALIAALSDASALVRGHAAWALGRLAGESARLALEHRRPKESESWVTEEIALALNEIATGPNNITASNTKSAQLDIP